MKNKPYCSYAQRNRGNCLNAKYDNKLNHYICSKKQYCSKKGN